MSVVTFLSIPYSASHKKEGPATLFSFNMISTGEKVKVRPFFAMDWWATTASWKRGQNISTQSCKNLHYFIFISLVYYLPVKSAAYGGDDCEIPGRVLGSGVLRSSWRNATLACAQSRKHGFNIINLGLTRLKISYNKPPNLYANPKMN